MRLPVPVVTRRPSLPLSAMVLPAPALVPPMVLPAAPATISIPRVPFGNGAPPAGLRPTVLPWTTFPVEPFPEIWMPIWVLPEITFPAPAPVPPMVLPGASETKMPRMYLALRSRCKRSA